MTYMNKVQIYLPDEEIEHLKATAARSGRSVADVVREAIRRFAPRPAPSGPVALWDGEPARSSDEHDSIHDEV